MNILFFQNCISPHQIPYIKELSLNSYVDKIFLLVPRYDYNERKEMGWDNKKLIYKTNIKLFYKPSEEIIRDLLKNNINSYCFFSGIRADHDIFNWFNISLDYNVRRYIITEPPFTFNKPLWMHYIRFFLQDYKYVQYINGVFAIGEEAVKYYKNISKKWKVFPFQYVTEHHKRLKGTPNGKLKLLYIGNLCKRKNVKIVIQALKGLEDIEFTIVGDGKERHVLEKIAYKNNVSVSFIGVKNMEEIPYIIQEHDVLVLPSLHDGWGAVVNEAMDLGLYVIVSNKCGAKMMIEKEKTGDIFISNNVASLKKSITNSIILKNTIRDRINNNIVLFEKFRGKSVSQYFINCIKE